MKIIINAIQIISLEFESTDTIDHVIAEVLKIQGTPPDDQRNIDLFHLYKHLENDKTLAFYGIKEGSMLRLQITMKNPCEEVGFPSLAGMIKKSPRSKESPIIKKFLPGPPMSECHIPMIPMIYPERFELDELQAVYELQAVIERPLSPKNDDRLYFDEFKSEWREEHGKELMHLLLKLCQDGTISEGNITQEAWRMIQNGLDNSTNCNFEIDYLKERLSEYKQLYSLIAETSSPIFHWDREKKIITITDPNWKEYHRTLLSCGEYIPYFSTLEEVCLLPSTRRLSEQQVSETSTNINVQ